MSQILLTNTEIDLAMFQIVETKTNIHNWFSGDPRLEAIAQAQLKKVRDKIALVEIPQGKEAGYNVDDKQYIALAMAEADWQSFLQEVEDVSD